MIFGVAEQFGPEVPEPKFLWQSIPTLSRLSFTRESLGRDIQPGAGRSSEMADLYG